MTTRCKVCKHPARNEIDEKLLAGASPRELADEYDLHYQGLYRHKDKHIPLTLVKAHRLQEADAADDLLQRVEDIYSKAWDIVSMAEESGKLQAGVGALKEARSCLELIGKLLGQLKSGTTVNVHYNPQWVELRGTIYSVLEEFPEARIKLAAALSEVEEDEEIIDV